MNGIVFRGEKQAFKLGKLRAIQSDSFEIPFDKTLFVEPNTRIPVDLLPAAWHFLERWDMAAPLWKNGATAADVGTTEERAATQAIIRDLRVLLHAYELLFVRKNETGLAFMQTWQAECANGNNKRLGFLRALYQIKPRLCVLPTSWLAEVQQGSPRFPPAQPLNGGKPLVTVELEPGRSVKCHAGDEEKVLAHFRRQKKAGR